MPDSIADVKALKRPVLKNKYDADLFDIGLSSHFLLMYTVLGYDFHIA